MSDIPIDIHYNKLLDWLVNRRHCNTQWQSECLSIRKSINEAIQDMPEHEEIKQLLAGSYINYFHCMRIVEILRDTEAASKNLFGRYSSQRMKDWQNVVHHYEKDDIYLGEAAQLLMRSVNYEIPALKKQISKCQQMQTDCVRKEGENLATANEYRDKYHSQCKQMGIQGKNVKRELLALVQDLPKVYETIVDKTKLLNAPAQYYSDFVTFTLNKPAMGESTIPLVKYIYTHGNTTTMQHRTGVKPTRVVDMTADLPQDDDEEKAAEDGAEEIDWGGDDINYDITAEDSGAQPEIDFGDDADTGINWDDVPDVTSVDIEIVDSSVPDKQITADSSSEEGVATGDDALTLLDHVPHRNQFINELVELQSFFTQRLRDLHSSDGDVISGNQFQNAPASLQLQVAEVEKMSSLVTDVYTQLSNKRMQELLLIRSSPSYVDRVSAKLQSLLSDADKITSLSRLMVTRREEARLEEKDFHPKLDLMRRKNKELKGQIENEISKKYKNRRVNIMGEINTV